MGNGGDVGARAYCGRMATGRARDTDAGAAVHAHDPAGSVSRVLAASAVRLLEQDVDAGDAETQRAVDDAVEAIAGRLVRLADLCHGLALDESPPPRGSSPRGGGP